MVPTTGCSARLRPLQQTLGPRPQPPFGQRDATSQGAVLVEHPPLDRTEVTVEHVQIGLVVEAERSTEALGQERG